MKRKLWLIISGVSLAILMIPAYSLLYTETGLNWLMQIAIANSPDKISYQSLKGSLSSDIKISQLRYKTADIDMSFGHITLKWEPWNLTRGMLQVDALHLEEIDIRTISSPNNNTNEPIELPQINLPFRFILKDLNLIDLRIYSDNTESFHLTTLNLKAKSKAEDIIIPHLAIETDEFKLTLNGKIKPQNQYPIDISTNFQLNELFTEPFKIKATLKGDLKKLKTLATVDGFVKGSVNGSLFDIVNNLHWDANAKVKTLNLQSFSTDLPPNNIAGEFKSHGSLNKFKFVGNAVTQDPKWGDITAKYDASIVGNELIIQDLQLSEKNHPTRLNSQGSINWGEEEVAYIIGTRWQQLNWPWTGESEYQSNSGNLTFNGKLSNYILNIESNLEANGYPPLHFVAETTGDLQSLTLKTFQINTLNGYINGQGLLNWQKEFRWDTKLSLNQINPAFFYTDFNGQINANILSSGSISDDILNTHLVSKNISGKFQDRLLLGSVDVKLNNKDISIKRLDLKLDGTELTLQGDISEQNNLQFNLSSENLSGVIPELLGQLDVSGKILGKRNIPQLIADIKANNISYNKYKLGSLSSTTDISMDPQQTLLVNLTADNVQLNEDMIDSIKLNANGILSQHSISLNLKKLENMIDLNVTGQFIDNIWNADIVNSEIKTKELGNWRLKQSSHVVLKENYLELEKNCYTQQQTELCFEADFKSDDLIANVNWKNLAINQFKPWLPSEIEIHSLTNGLANLTYTDNKLFASVNADNTAGNIAIDTDEGEQQVKFGAGTLTFDWDPQNVRSKFLLPLENNATLESSLFIDQSNAALSLLQAPLKADLSLQLPTLVFFEPFVPEIKNLGQARAQTKLKISGTLQQPIIIGNINALAKELEVPNLNITLKNVEINAKINEKQLIKFSGKTTSDKGNINIFGNANLKDKETWVAEANIQGNNFLAIDLPEATVQVSPEISIKLSNDQITIKGDITVPYARLRPKKLPKGTVTESADLVITETSGSKKTTKTPWQIDSELRLVLGDRVSFDGFGLRSNLTGSLQIVDKHGEVTVGRGEINLIEGYYRSFGQELEISKGRLLFANTPVDNPGLDIKAQRNIGEITAGINVTSTLRKPEVNLFSTPLMAESDALSYLLLGRPLRQVDQKEGSELMTTATAMGLAGSALLARSIGNRLGIEEVQIQTDTDAGTSSLVIGRYLSPKLYIRYYTGIFERSNIVQLRYNVSNKVILQTETGSQMGADVFYTIER